MASISATTEDVCPCCGECDGATLWCRTRGGTATLCGHTEFDSPSTPPKAYRVKTFSGTIDVSYYSGTCGGPYNACDNSVYSGSDTYDASTCVLTTGRLQTYKTTDCIGACSPLGASAPFLPAAVFTPGASGALIVTNTQTTNTLSSSGNCGSSPVCGGSANFVSGSATATLTSEDTETDAITRLLAGAGGTWSSFTVVGDGTSGTCLNPACCTAKYQQRTTGFSFGYQEAGFRVTKTGLVPSTSYDARVKIYRRVYGSVGAWTLYATAVVSATTDGSGNFTKDGTVPNDVGFETYAESACVKLSAA